MEVVTLCGLETAGGRQGEAHAVQRGQRAATCGVGKLQTAQVLLR